MQTERKLPNILVTGTPGTGKTTTCELVASISNLQHIEIGSLVKDKGLHSGFDSTYNSYILDEDKILDELEPYMSKGGVIVDHHGCDFFPQRWFDLIVVLTVDNTILYQRLENRGYSDIKIQENVTCEIMRVVIDEAYESYDSDAIVELTSNSIEEMESNVSRIEKWIHAYISQ